MGKTLFALLAPRALFLPHIERNHLPTNCTNCTNVQDCFCKKIKRRQLGARRAVRGAADEEQEQVQSKVFLLECHCLTSMILHIKGI